MAERILLVGDAAALINPLNGEGIQYALLSARWAAEAVSACYGSNDFSEKALSAYAAQVQQELRYDMALAGMIVQLIRNRNLNPVWLRALQIIVTRAQVDPTYADIIGSVLAGMAPSTSVVNYKIVMSTIKQAVMSLGLDFASGLFRGPRHWVKQGKQSSKAGVELLAGVAQNPGDYLEWGVGVADQGAELARQVFSRLIGSTSVHFRMTPKMKKVAGKRESVLQITLDHVNDQFE